MTPSRTTQRGVTRRRFLSKAASAGAGLAGLSLVASQLLVPKRAQADPATDQEIINAAATAEALAVTMYFNIVTSNIWEVGLKEIINDQAYLVAGFEEELNHYNLLVSAGASPLATTFYFPTGMFGGPATYQTTLNTLVTLEDAFIAAYLIGIRDLDQGYKVLAGQIMGIEAEHRVLARDIGSDLGLETLTGLSGIPAYLNGPKYSANNLAYEQTFSAELPDIAAVVSALGPFVSPGASGFSTKPYDFTESTVLPDHIHVLLSNDSP